MHSHSPVIVAVLVLIGVVVVLLELRKLRQERRARRRLHEEFLEAFGFQFFPGLPYTHVRIRLQFLASLFHEASEFQAEMQVRYADWSFLWSYMRDLSDERVKVTKMAFWHAQNVAKKLGFKVSARHTDYLHELTTQVAA